MSCSKFLLIGGLNKVSTGIEKSLSTDTTEPSSTNVKHKEPQSSVL